MTSLTTQKQGRITARVPQTVQERLQQAADLMGATLNQFLVEAAVEKAEKIIERERMIALFRQDAAMFVKLLDNPGKPNKALSKALERYKKKVISGDVNTNAGLDTLAI
jgi:uncharacterized protein (DUF1778 family)